MSVRFSGDGNELVAGTKDNCVYIYDITAGHPVLRLKGHRNEVNAVCYGDESSPHIIYSGSDDCTVKIWDRRSISGTRPVGVFTGHTEGITSIASKGDGRYVLSNGKDQQMKLWDLRFVLILEAGETIFGNFGTAQKYDGCRRLRRIAQDESVNRLRLSYRTVRLPQSYESNH